MSEHPTWMVGNRNPSISETIVDDNDDPVDLNSPAATVRFRARVVDSTALIVDQVATIVQTGSGVGAVNKGAVRYDWSAADAQTTVPIGALGQEQELLVWWQVTSGGKTQDLMEALIAVSAHAPGLNAYAELEEFKSTLTLTGTTFTDLDARRCLVAASRGVDYLAGQRFYLDPDATTKRYYSWADDYELSIDALSDLTSVKVDRDGDGVYEETWVENTDFALEPVNAVIDGKPWTKIRILRQRTNFGVFPDTYPNAIEVTGQYGFAAVPEGIKTATLLLAARLFKAVREAPWGVIGFDQEGAVRISRELPDFQLLLGPSTRRKLLV